MGLRLAATFIRGYTYGESREELSRPEPLRRGEESREVHAGSSLGA
jgi:hypothetical protein